jgi:hypothetical protein
MTGTHHEDQQPKEPNRINPVAIIAGALASLSAAVVASYFGVAGTLIGAAVVSVISSVAAALYAGLLGRGQGIVQRTASTVLHPSPDRTGVHSAPDQTTDNPSQGAVEAPAPGEAQASGEVPGARSGVRWPWRRSVVVIGAAALIFVIAIGAVSGIEAALKEPIATALGVRERGQARTSVGVAVDRAGGSATTRSSSPSSSSTQAPPSSQQRGQAPPTTEPGSSTTGSTEPPSTTLPPTTSQPSSPSS